ncbi:MAG: NAD+ synthase [Deltaproteobacteria bacterium]|nr:NAD+ synthase [Deltaproteobacteria bacterium]
MKIALGQIDPTIGDFAGNLRLIEQAAAGARRAGADLLVLPELALCGYPPRDLLERDAFLAASDRALERLVANTRDGLAILVGFPETLPAPKAGRRLANAAALVEDGHVVAIRRKSLLPFYDVFDEWRYFEPAESIAPVPFRGHGLGISICEDIWNDGDFWPQPLYREDPIAKLVSAGADVLVNIAASPYTVGKRHLRPRMLGAVAKHWRRPLVFVNQVGGQDDLVFDGSSLAFDARGEIVARAAEHREDLVVVDVEAGRGDMRPFVASDARSALEALVLGTRDYARRCGFAGALVGLSGGIDSAVVACIASRALGAPNVLGVAMPSRYSSEHSRRDAADLAKNLGIEFREIAIEPMFAAYLEALAPAFAGRPPDVTEENLQARIRGALLMALSNKFGKLLLSTGNKSEIATGYCTLYGDTNGGLAVISDVPKMLVYGIAREINAEHPDIPESTLTKPPSAELRPGQVDQDSLPPYDVLDQILQAHVEEGLDAQALVAKGFEPSVVEKVLRLVRVSEYKRRQLPPGLKITGKAFGTGRRYPIAQGFRG